MRINEKTGEWMRKCNRYYSHGHTSQGKTIRTGYAENPEIVLQKTEKQR